MAKGNFTTSQARLHLYQYLEELQDRVVHYDTDSVIYKATAIENDQLLLQHKGDLLGQLKDETGGVPIVKFAGAAPKAYSYVLANGKAEVKLQLPNSKLSLPTCEWEATRY
ncbi:hypothetical protein QR680_011424 [Steinernema hermaphroditum]|uniref:DNA-directed DNA polymerase n=1 Tax=Steinernema hermaphroditum TaxID=289476 RepID=A0AA39HYG2_9BILA|nr:hypothetical protein QR680_011424 [Steinernema hermaphroditum]